MIAICRMTRLAVVFSAILAGSVVQAQVALPITGAAQSAQKKERRKEAFKDWWVWSLTAAFTTATIVTSVVIATVPRGSLNPQTETMALTVRF